MFSINISNLISDLIHNNLISFLETCFFPINNYINDSIVDKFLIIALFIFKLTNIEPSLSKPKTFDLQISMCKIIDLQHGKF